MSGKERDYEIFLKDLLELFKKALLFTDMDKIFYEIGNFTYSNIDCENIIIWLWNERDEVLKPFKYWGFTSDEMKPEAYNSGEGVIGFSFKNNVPVKENDLKSSPYFVSKSPLENRIRDLLMCPITRGGAPIGIFDVSNKKNGTFDDADFNKLLLISMITSLFFHIREQDREHIDNYRFYSIVIDLLSMLNIGMESDRQLFETLAEVLKRSFRTPVSMHIRKGGISFLKLGKEFNDPPNYPDRNITLSIDDRETIISVEVENYHAYIMLEDSRDFNSLIDFARKNIFLEVLKRLIFQYITQKSVRMKNMQLDLLYRISLESLDSEKKTLDLLRAFSNEIYETYKLSSFEFYKVNEKGDFVKEVAEGLYKKENVAVSGSASAVQLLMTQDFFVLDMASSFSASEYKFLSDVKEETVSLFSTGISYEGVLKFIMVFRWNELFSPELNFFNFIDLLKKEIIAKETTVVLLDNLHNVIDETLKLLMTLLSYKDMDIIEHSKRVADIANVLSELFSLRIDPLEIKISALLHDLGKVGIADELVKSKKIFTQTEHDMMKKHSTIGYELIRNYHFSDIIKEGVHLHHERWDGSGYPNGLAGESIPVHVRILAIADSIDGIMAERHYKDKGDTEKLRRELSAGMGKHYDPTFIEILLDNWTVFIDRISSLYED